MFVVVPSIKPVRLKKNICPKTLMILIKNYSFRTTYIYIYKIDKRNGRNLIITNHHVNRSSERGRYEVFDFQ